jgi:hypothetical protein
MKVLDNGILLVSIKDLSGWIIGSGWHRTYGVADGAIVFQPWLLMILDKEQYW